MREQLEWGVAESARILESRERNSALNTAPESERAAQPAAQHQVEQHRGQRVKQRVGRELSVHHLPVLAEEGVDRH